MKYLFWSTAKHVLSYGSTFIGFNILKLFFFPLKLQHAINIVTLSRPENKCKDLHFQKVYLQHRVYIVLESNDLGQINSPRTTQIYVLSSRRNLHCLQIVLEITYSLLKHNDHNTNLPISFPPISPSARRQRQSCRLACSRSRPSSSEDWPKRGTMASEFSVTMRHHLTLPSLKRGI